MWKPIKDTPNYISECGKFIAIYKHSFCGLACYWTFKVSEKKRMQKNAVAIGGLPSRELLNRL